MEPLLPDAAREVAAWAKELLTKDDMTALEMSERFPVQLDPAVTTLPRDGTLGVWGQLTKRGLRQMLALGTELRALYIKTGFLPKEAGGVLTLEGSPAPPLRDVLHCYSSHYARTQNSVQAVLCGMYPESSRAAMEKGRDAGNAVPVRVRRPEEEYINVFPHQPELFQRMKEVRSRVGVGGGVRWEVGRLENAGVEECGCVVMGGEVNCACQYSSGGGRCGETGEGKARTSSCCSHIH